MEIAKNRFCKEYFENYAKLSLKYIYPQNHLNFKILDCPDLQNKIDNIGIEVVMAIEEYEANFYTFLNSEDYKILSVSEKNEKMQKRLKIKEKSKMPCEFYEHGCSIVDNNESYFPKIEKTLEKKKDKYEQYKSYGFDKVGLYIFSFGNLEKNEIIKPFYQIITKYKFDFYIINTFFNIYHIKPGFTCDSFEITNEDKKDFNKLSLKYIKDNSKH